MSDKKKLIFSCADGVLDEVQRLLLSKETMQQESPTGLSSIINQFRHQFNDGNKVRRHISFLFKQKTNKNK